MCKKCFENEITQFDTAEHFANFEISLEQKLKENDGLFFLRPSSQGELTEYTIYSCKNCLQKWYLEVPNTLKPGFLLKEKNAQDLLIKLEKSDDKNRYLTIGVCIIVMLVCLIFLMAS